MTFHNKKEKSLNLCRTYKFKIIVTVPKELEEVGNVDLAVLIALSSASRGIKEQL